ncbi:hypothetical protein BaRGS_00037794 [Batillaria attramentaria]|uniref:Uncharacterized protein n=1 Tax=Batillaria attramentaria TaxID=370345 RepID=A0ABD0J854_9CAEN
MVHWEESDVCWQWVQLSDWSEVCFPALSPPSNRPMPSLSPPVTKDGHFLHCLPVRRPLAHAAWRVLQSTGTEDRVWLRLGGFACKPTVYRLLSCLACCIVLSLRCHTNSPGGRQQYTCLSLSYHSYLLHSHSRTVCAVMSAVVPAPPPPSFSLPPVSPVNPLQALPVGVQ